MWWRGVEEMRVLNCVGNLVMGVDEGVGDRKVLLVR